MRIAYLVTGNPGPLSGVWKKIQDQTRAWSAAGERVALFLLARPEIPLGAVPDGVEIVAETYHGSLSRLRPLHNLIDKVLAWRPDVVYLRYALHYEPIRGLARRVPMVGEINTNDLGEYRQRSVRQHAYNIATRGRLLSKLAGMVFVTDELRSHKAFARFGRPSAVIGNSIDLSRIPQLPTPGNERPTFVFMTAELGPWHGFDDIRWLALERTEWRFHVIGPLEAFPDVSDNVRLHGMLPQSDYEQIVGNADVAIGSLGIYRNRMREATPLKVREYLGFGLPTVVAYTDTDFTSAFPYLLQLPAVPHALREHLDDVDAFVERVRSARVPRELVHHVDVTVKEPLRLEFLRASCA